jgi:hypothetical protein
VTAQDVGSGDLLGDRALPIERAKPVTPKSPEEGPSISLPIRGFELLGMLDGEEPFTSAVSHALGSAFSDLISDVNCATGAEAPNVKDEPRPERTRLVQRDELQSEASIQKCRR